MVAEARKTGWRGPLGTVLRVIVSAAFVVLLLSRLDLEAVRRALADLEIWMLAAAAAAMVGTILLGAVRWQIFLRTVDIRLQMGTVLRMYFVGMFFNAFLPTGVGGDAYKAVQLRRAGWRLSGAVASMVVDRVLGMLGLGLLALVGVIALAARDGVTPPVAVAGLLLVGMLGVLAVLVVYGERLAGRGRAGKLRIRERARTVLSAIATCLRSPRDVVRGLAAGTAAQACMLVAHLFGAAAIGIEVPILTMVVLLFIVSVAATLPLTVNGLGVREAAWVWGLTAAGSADAEAAAFALVMLVVSLFASALGGAVYMLAGGSVPDRRGELAEAEGPAQAR